MPARRAGSFLTRSVREGLRRGGPHAADEMVLEEIYSGNISGVEELLATGGANLDGSDDLVMPPIAVAACQGQLDIVELLHQRGANMNTPAGGDCYPEAGKLLCKKSWRPLHIAVGTGQVVAIRALLKFGADPNGADEVGTTPLMAAACVATPAVGHRYSLVQALLEGGADPESGNEWGMTALHFAARGGDTDVMAILLRRAPCTLNMADNMDYTALSHAAKFGPCYAVSYLLSAGASDEALLAHTGNSALLRSIEEGQEDKVRLLLDEGMDAVGGIPAMSMALQLAIEGRRVAILQMLVAVGVGADVSEEHWARHTLDDAGVPALHYAAAFGSLSTVHVLLAAGADETAPSSDGKRASDVVGQGRPAAEEAAICRMLERGPAFHASSWLWLVGVDSALGGTPAVRNQGPSLGVRVFRRENRRVFPTRFAR